MQRHLNTCRILIVEDDANVLMTLQMMLVEMGVSITNITTATNGTLALQKLDAAAQPFDLLISDWNMPQKNGLDLLKEVRQAHPTMPFLMVTARADKESIVDARDNNVTAYIRKPVAFDEFKKKILAILPAEQ